MGQLPYHDLVVWKEAYQFVIAIYTSTKSFPKHELYAVVSQLRRAAVSVVTNLVEGHAKHSNKDFLRYLDISHGSILECAVLLELSRDLKYLSPEEYDELEKTRSRTSYLLDRLILSLR